MVRASYIGTREDCNNLLPTMKRLDAHGPNCRHDLGQKITHPDGVCPKTDQQNHSTSFKD